MHLHKALSATMIYVTHDQAEAMTMGDRICIMAGGKVAQIGRPMDVYPEPANTFAASSLGNPPMNLLPATATHEGVTVQGATLPLPAGAPGTKITFGIRPEDILPTKNTGPETLAGRVASGEPLGAETLITVDVDGAPLIVRGPRDVSANIDAPIHLACRADRVRPFGATTGTILGKTAP